VGSRPGPQGALAMEDRKRRGSMELCLLKSSAALARRARPRANRRTISLGCHCWCPLITCGDADLRHSGSVPVSARQLP